jgi:NTE family protein
MTMFSQDESNLGRLFARERERGEANWFSLPGGAPLYEPGEPAEFLYLVKAGRLGAFRQGEMGERQFLGVIRPGEPAGEMSLITGLPHTGHVVALRDSEILAIAKDRFFDLADQEAEVMTDLARLMMMRTRQTATRSDGGNPTVFGLIAIDQSVCARDLAEDLERDLESHGFRVTVVGNESALAPTEWFSNVERDHDLVIFAAESHQTTWRSVCGRQVDRMFLIGHGDNRPPAVLDAPMPLRANQMIDLVLVHRPLTAAPRYSDTWLDLTGAARLFHIRERDRGDIARLGRIMTGRSVGLVLSGGGARAYAHVGAIRALHQAQVPIDFVGGVSMGAVIAAGLAMGWDDAEMDRRIRAAFVTSSPLDDIAFPLIAMTRGLKVKDRLREHFGTEEIADLWLPFFCLSSNLTTGATYIHRRGQVRHALRATISLPGVLPPVSLGKNVLVDGAVMKNFPADVMRSMHQGPVVGIDVTRGRSLEAEDVRAPKSLWNWLVSGEWRKGPPIVALLMRAATVSTGRDLASSREATDVLIMPKVDNVDIRDWTAFDPSIAEGFQATQDALEKLTAPVTELRQTPASMRP